MRAHGCEPRSVWIAAFVIVTLAAGTTLAAEPKKPSTLVKLSRHAKVKLRVIELYRSRGNMEGADLVRGYTILAPSLRLPFAKWGELDISTRYDVKRYDFDGQSDLVDGVKSSGTPFKDLHNYSIRIGTNMRLAENVFWSMGGYSRAKWETGANLHDATRVGAFTGLGVQVFPRLFVGLGAGMRKKLDGSKPAFGPIWTLHVQLLDNLDFEVRNTKVKLRLKIDKRFQIHLISGYTQRPYQLRKRGNDKASKVTESSIPAFVRLDWRVNPHVQLEFNAGVLLDQELKTNAGDTKQSIKQGVAAYLGVGLRFRN